MIIGLAAGIIGAVAGTFGRAKARSLLARTFGRDLPAALLMWLVALSRPRPPAAAALLPRTGCTPPLGIWPNFRIRPHSLQKLVPDLPNGSKCRAFYVRTARDQKHRGIDRVDRGQPLVFASVPPGHIYF